MKLQETACNNLSSFAASMREFIQRAQNGDVIGTVGAAETVVSSH